MKKGIRYYYSLISEQPQPFRFLLGQMLRQTRLCKYFTIKRRFYSIQFHPTAFSASLWISGDTSSKDEEFLISFLREGDVVIDVGANIGTLTMPAAALVGETGQVYSIEAHPRTFNYLQQNLKRNGYDNVRVFNYAVGKEEGTLYFSDKRADDTNSVVSQSELRVPVTTLDKLISPEIDKVNLLKIDVEGYEKFVCLGARELLQKTDCVYFESCESHFQDFGYSTSDLLHTLVSEGFACYRINPSGIEAVTDSYVSTCCENLIAVKDSKFLTTRLEISFGSVAL